MITSENSPLDTIEQTVRKLVFNDLLDDGRLNLYLFRKLCLQAGLRTVDDLCQDYISIQDFIDRNKGTGKRAASELLSFLISLEENDTQATVSDGAPDCLTGKALVAYPPEVATISLEHLNRQELISNILFNKLHRDAKLQTVGDFYQQFRSIPDFQRKTYSVGKRVIDELTGLLEKLSTNPAPYLEAVEKEKDIYLPLNYQGTDNVLINFKRVIEDVKTILNAENRKTDSHHAAIIEYFFTDKQTKHQYSLEDVGGFLCLHRERVRQLKVEVVAGFTQWIHESNNEMVPKCFVVAELRDQLKSLFERLSSRFDYVANEVALLHFFAEEQIQTEGLNSRAIDLLFEIYGISRCGKSETNFTEANFYVLNPKFDHKSFLAVANIVLDVLKDKVIPIDRNQLITQVNKGIKTYKGVHSLKPGKIPHHFIDIALAQLPEIETLSTGTDFCYQIQYPYLSSIAARVERILFELCGRRTFPEILAEMQTRADSYQLNDTIDETSVRSQILKGNGRVQAHGKLGLYEWVSSEGSETVKALSKVDLVKAALKSKGEAATLAEIEQHVNAHLTAIDAIELQNVKSTSAIISHLIKQGKITRLQRGRYILKNWEPRYIDQLETSNTARNPKGKIRAEVITILSASPDQTLPRRALSRLLFKAGYPRPTIASTITNNPTIDLFEKESVWFVRLKDNHGDFSKPLQKDQILKSMSDLLLNTKTNTLPLPIVVRKLEKDFSLSRGQLPVIYKIISANPHLFEKSESVAGQKILTLLAVPKSSDVSFEPDEHWPELKSKLIAKLDPQLSGILVHSLDETLETFFSVSMLSTGEADLEALDLLPGYIWKFFSGMADEHFEHSLVREIATSIEPYLLKILYLTAPEQYKTYQGEQSKGLSRINYLLSRVRYTHSQRLKNAYYKAKNTRDAAAHTARSWSSVDRSERVLACLIQMIYSIHSYFTQLQSGSLSDGFEVVEATNLIA